LPISRQNVTSVDCADSETLEKEVSLRSSEADLVIAGMNVENTESDEFEQLLRRFDGANDVLFVHASEKVLIE